MVTHKMHAGNEFNHIDAGVRCVCTKNNERRGCTEQTDDDDARECVEKLRPCREKSDARVKS